MSAGRRLSSWQERAEEGMRLLQVLGGGSCCRSVGRGKLFPQGWAAEAVPAVLGGGSCCGTSKPVCCRCWAAWVLQHAPRSRCPQSKAHSASQGGREGRQSTLCLPALPIPLALAPSFRLPALLCPASLEPNVLYTPVHVATRACACGRARLRLWPHTPAPVAARACACGRTLRLWPHAPAPVAARNCACGHTSLRLWPHAPAPVATRFGGHRRAGTPCMPGGRVGPWAGWPGRAVGRGYPGSNCWIGSGGQARPGLAGARAYPGPTSLAYVLSC